MSVTAGQDKSTLVSMSGQRGAWESETYAGKLMDLILPWIHHRVDALQQLTVAYNSRTTPTVESPALGVVALAGVVALIAIMLSAHVLQRVKPVHPELGMLGVLTVVAISFFSIGQLGSFVALFVTPQIRTWSRMFIVIALLGLLAVGHWVSVVSRRSRILGLVTAGALLVIGVLDQTNPAMAPNYKDLRTQVADLTSFSQSIEARVGPGCSVFQLPVVPFPENPPVHDMEDYAHFRPYLTSSSLRWSYGGFRGTSLSDWQLALPDTSTTGLVDDVVTAGFCAVEVDRAGLSDRGVDLDRELTALLGQPDSGHTRWSLGCMGRFAGTHQVDLSNEVPPGSRRLVPLVLHPLVVYSDRGATEIEHDKQTPYQWIGPFPEVNVYNFGRSTVRGVHLTFSLAAPHSSPRRFTVRLPNRSTQVVDVASGVAEQVQVTIDAAPGPNAVTITTTGAGEAMGKVLSPTNTDNRIVFGKLINLRVSVADPNVKSRCGPAARWVTN